MPKPTFILAIATIAISLCNAQLYVIESGSTGKLGPMLEDGFYFCPSKFSAVGWSIQCKLDKSVKGADIYVNGKKKMERYAPFLAAGNRGIMVYPLKGIKDGKLEVKCMGMDRTVYSATGKIGCSSMPNKATGTKPTASPMAETEKKTMMQENKMNMMKEEKEMSMASPEPMKEMAPVAPKSLTTKKDVEEENPVEAAPVMVKEENNGAASPGMTEVKAGGDYCIYRTGASHDNQPLPAGWVKQGTAVTYKPESNYGGVEKKGVSVLTYKFKVKYTSTYAVTLDMGTTHPTEHNDVFVRCSGGFNAMKPGNSFTADGFVKAYHNDNGRAVKAFTKDHDAHTLSTQKTLTAGMDYTCEIGARSTKTTIYGLVLFPCKGTECQANSNVWQSGIQKCAPQ